MIVGIVLALGLGLLTGLLNGIIVTRTNVPSLVVTLATLSGMAGLTLGLSRLTTGTTSVAINPDPLSKALYLVLRGRPTYGSEETGCPPRREQLLRVRGVAGTAQLLRDGQPRLQQSVLGLDAAAVTALSADVNNGGVADCHGQDPIW